MVGAEEKATRSVNIRDRDDQNTQSRGDDMPLDEAVQRLTSLKKERRLLNTL